MLLRMKDGKFDKNGEFKPISWKQAFDIMEEKCKATLKAKGRRYRHVRFRPGTVWEGYAAAKLMEGRFPFQQPRSQCPSLHGLGRGRFHAYLWHRRTDGCYDDIEHADAFFLWGSNMAEMHPILWTRITDRKLSSKHVKVGVLSTFEHRSFELADIPMVFKPNTDPAILNFICHHIISTGKESGLRQQARQFQEGRNRYRFRSASDPRTLEKKATNNGYPGCDGKPKGNPAKADNDHLRRFKKFVSEYTADKVAKISGVPAKDLIAMAELYADPKVKCVSFWTMGFNQHTRGTWVNNMICNVHLLVGKISEPGNSPFSLTGQPSACGTAREVGTFSHRLPADMVVTNPEHRKHTEELWQLPEGTINDKIGLHAVAMARAPEGWQGQLLLAAVQQQHAGRSEHQRGTLSGLAQAGELHRRVRSVSDGFRNGRRPHPADRHVG